LVFGFWRRFLREKAASWVKNNDELSFLKNLEEDMNPVVVLIE